MGRGMKRMSSVGHFHSQSMSKTFVRRSELPQQFRNDLTSTVATIDPFHNVKIQELDEEDMSSICSRPSAFQVENDFPRLSITNK